MIGSEDAEDDGLLKFRVVAAGRIPPVTVIDGETVYVGPVNADDNHMQSPSPLEEIPLPRVIASYVPRIEGTSELDPVAWSNLAAQVYSQGRSNMVKWRREANHDLNSEPQDGTSFRWDVKLCRYMTPKYDPEDPSLQNNKCKNSRRVLNELWQLLAANKRHPLMQTDLRNALRQGDWHLTDVDVLEDEIVTFVETLLNATRDMSASLQGGGRHTSLKAHHAPPPRLPFTTRALSIPPPPPLPITKKKAANA